MNIAEEKDLIIKYAKLGSDISLSRLGLIKDEISEREAFRLFGQGKVKTWKNIGLVKRVKVGAGNSKSSYSRIELETISRLENERKLR